MAGEQTRFAVGNEAARKYSLEAARDIFQRVLDHIEENEEVVFLNQPLNALGYYAHLPTYLLNIYGEDEVLVELSDRITSMLEERIVMASLTGKTKEATSIFVMKAKFGMKEVQHVHTTSGEALEGAGKSEMQKALERASPEQLERLLGMIQEIEHGDGSASAELAE